MGINMNIEKYGESKRCRIAKELFERTIDKLHLVFLPIPTSRDGVHVNGSDVSLENILDKCSVGTLIVGYKIPLLICDKILERGAIYLDLNLDEEFVYDNAVLSADGALGYILSSFDLSVRDMKIGIVGYGRIGKRLFSSLSFLGASPKVYTTNEKTALQLSENGVDVSYNVGGVRDFSGLDLLINTAPTNLSPSFENGTLPNKMRVIELASGENFKGVEGVERLPSIPEIMYPVSGGNIYYRAIIRFLKGV
jgi:hypothetical protein